MKHLIVLSSVPPSLPLSLPDTASSIINTSSSNCNNNNSINYNYSINSSCKRHESAPPQVYALDQLDDFNHPRHRRDIILNALQREQLENCNNVEILFDIPSLRRELLESRSLSNDLSVSTVFHNIYSTVHSTPLLDFFESAWKKWLELGNDGRDPIGCKNIHPTDISSSNSSNSNADDRNIPLLIPACTPLLLCHNSNTRNKTVVTTQQRESKHVIGQMSYYCTDSCTPIFHELMQELYNDALLLQTCLDRIKEMNNALCVSSSNPTTAPDDWV